MVSKARKTAYPDVATVIAISSEMVTSLDAIIEKFPRFVEDPITTPISEEIANVCAAANLLSLRVVEIVGEEIAEMAIRVESGSLKGDQVFDVMKAAIFGLHRYLTTASGGKIVSGFSVYPHYEAVTTLLADRKVLLKTELFLPVAPLHGEQSENYSESAFVSEVTRYQIEFEREMLKFHHDKSAQALHAMRTALVTIETKNPPPNYRTFLSLAIIYMDVASQAGDIIAQDDEPLLVLINDALICCTRGELNIENGTISWLLFVAAHASNTTSRLRQFQDTYELNRLFSEDTLQITEDQLSNARDIISDTKRSWERNIAETGDPTLAKAAALAMATAFSTMGDYALKTLSVSIASLADAVASGKLMHDAEISVFGASLLIAISDRLDRVAHDPKGGRAVADFHKERVRAVMGGTKPSDLSAELPEQHAHVQSILDEIKSDIHSIEQIVDQCLRGEFKHEKIDDVAKLFNTVYCALTFVNMEDGAEYVNLVADEVDQALRTIFNHDDIEDTVKLRIVELVMLLTRYLSVINVDNNQAQDALKKGMAMFSLAEEEDAAELIEIDGVTDVCTDQEIGPIFFDEAKEVINSSILPGLVKLRGDPSNESTFLDVRRGFHTLKGSARMVDLTNLGMIGQHVEFTLNIIRDDKSAKLSGLMISWLESAAKFFIDAIVILEQSKPVPADPAPYLAVYEHFRDYKVFPENTLPTEKAVIAERRSAATETPSVVIDDLTRENAVQLARLEEAQRVGKQAAREQEELQAKLEAQELASIALKASEELREVARLAAVAEEEKAEAAARLLASQLEAAAESLSAETERARLEQIEAHQKEEALLTIKRAEAAEAEAARKMIAEFREKNLEEERAAAADAELARQEQLVQDSMINAAPEIPASDPVIMIGSIQLAAQLFSAFVAEARGFTDVMQVHLDLVLAGQEKRIGFEFMRLAHSLAGMGRTTGLLAISDLAYTLESWSALNQDHDITLDASSIDTLSDAMTALASMVMGVENYIEPVTDSALIAKMTNLIEINEHFVLNGRGAEDVVSESVITRLKNGGGSVSDTGVTRIIEEKDGAATRSSIPAEPSKQRRIKSKGKKKTVKPQGSLPTATWNALKRAAQWIWQIFRIK